MLNTYNKTSVQMPAPCVGTLQKTHEKSQFVRFDVHSEMAGYVFSERPRVRDDGYKIVILQLMVFGNDHFVMEYMYEEDFRQETLEGEQ